MHALFLPATYLLLGAAYVIAVAIPSIWSMISLVGSISGTIMCFIMPAMCAMVFLRGPSTLEVLQRGLAWVVGLLGCLVFINGLAAFLVPR